MRSPQPGKPMTAASKRLSRQMRNVIGYVLTGLHSFLVECDTRESICAADLLQLADVRQATTPTNLVLAESQARSARRRS